MMNFKPFPNEIHPLNDTENDSKSFFHKIILHKKPISFKKADKLCKEIQDCTLCKKGYNSKEKSLVPISHIDSIDSIAYVF